MGLQEEIYAKIKEEIANDPFSVGYAGKSDDEIKVLLNEPIRTQKIIEDVSPSPMNRILSGIADAPNVISTQDVTDSKK